MIRWVHEGRGYVQFGLLQIAKNPLLNGYTGSDHWSTVDPPVYHRDVLQWLKDHPDCGLYDVGGLGPPGFVFASPELADEFLQRFAPNDTTRISSL